MERAQMLQNLRTGGPRSNSYSSPSPATTRFATEDMTERMNLINFVDESRIQQQQHQLMMMQAQAQVNALLASQGNRPSVEAQAMQLELLRLQALQQQQNFQTQMMLQQQQQQPYVQTRRLSEMHVPTTPTEAAQQTRSGLANQLRARAVGREASLMKTSIVIEEHQQPLSPVATVKFGPTAATTRSVSSPLNPKAASFVGRFNPDLSAAIAAANNNKAVASTEVQTPNTPTYGATTVISGGTSLGSLASTPSNSVNSLSSVASQVASPTTKSDNASSWRRGPSESNLPSRKSPSPPLRSYSPPEVSTPIKTRPSPLRFAGAATTDARSTSPSSNSGSETKEGSSSPTTTSSSSPPSSAGSAQLREEASRKLYEGLGIGRPFNPNATPFVLNVPTFVHTAPTPIVAQTPSVANFLAPIRQPMGPPRAADELGSSNFASRMRKRALMNIGEARDRRVAQVAY